MQSPFLSFISDSPLFEHKQTDNVYERVPESELERELARYREHVLKQINDGGVAFFSSDTKLRVFSSDEKTPVEILKQCALYVEEYVVSDPVFALSEPPNPSSEVFKQYLGMTGPRVDKSKLREAASYLLAIEPFARAGYVSVLPASIIHERPREIPILTSETGYRDLLPRPLMAWFIDRAVVSTCERVEGGFVVTDRLGPCRTILVEFAGFDDDGMGFNLMEQRVERIGDNGHLQMISHLPDSAPEEGFFREWVQQSICRAADRAYRHRLREATLAAQLGSFYLATSPGEAELLRLSLGAPENAEVHTTNLLLDLDLPYMRQLGADQLMRVRSENGESFARFRISLERRFLELRQIDDERQRAAKAADITHELMDLNVRELELDLKALRQRLTLDVGIATLGLAGSVQSAGVSLLASAAAIADGYKSLREYMDSRNTNPAYFSLQLKRELHREKQPGMR